MYLHAAELLNPATPAQIGNIYVPFSSIQHSFQIGEHGEGRIMEILNLCITSYSFTVVINQPPFHLSYKLMNIHMFCCQLPQCLCIHLQRVTWRSDGLPSRREEQILFPEYLDMSLYKQTSAVNNIASQTGASLLRLISEDETTPTETSLRYYAVIFVWYCMTQYDNGNNWKFVMVQ